MRRLAALVACLLAGCAPGRGVVELTVQARGTLVGVDTLVVTVSQSGQVALPVEFPVPGRPTTIPPSLKFELLFAASRRGPISVQVDALDSQRLAIASASGDGEVIPSEGTSMSVELPGAFPDLGAPIEAGVDARLPVDAAPDLSSTLDAARDLSPPRDAAKLPDLSPTDADTDGALE